MNRPTEQDYRNYRRAVSVWWNGGNPSTDFGPSLGWNNGFKGWRIDAGAARKDGAIVRLTFGLSGDIPFGIDALMKTIKKEVAA